jgi:molybdenum cofactor cytidylyltransferase
MNNLPTVLVLAAGRGERFLASGGQTHKLAALLAGKPVLEHVLDAVRGSGLDFEVVRAHPAQPGMGDSIAAGVRATSNACGWLILPADLPLIQSATLLQIALAAPCAVTVPRCGGVRGHPVRFAASCYAQLADLKGNSGAAQVISAVAAIKTIAFVEVDDIGICTDVDTVADLAAAEGLLAQRQSIKRQLGEASLSSRSSARS